MWKDELLGLADSAESDQIFKSHGLNMDVLYRAGETPQVFCLAIECLLNKFFLLGRSSCSFSAFAELRLSQLFIMCLSSPGHCYLHSSAGFGRLSR